MRLVRAIIGILSLAGGIAYVLYAPLATKSNIVIEKNYLIMEAVLFLAWIILSVISKVGMIIGSRKYWPTWFAVAAWGLFGIMLISYIYGTAGVSAQATPLTQLENIFGLFMFIGWPIVDLLDLTLLRPVTN